VQKCFDGSCAEPGYKRQIYMDTIGPFDTLGADPNVTLLLGAYDNVRSLCTFLVFLVSVLPRGIADI